MTRMRRGNASGAARVTGTLRAGTTNFTPQPPVDASIEEW